MAEKYSPNDIENLGQDWGSDLTDIPLKRPFSGRAVQKLIKDELSALQSEKIGSVKYEGGALVFYDKDEGTVISTVTLSGTIYTISLETETPPSFNVLTGDLTKTVTITPTSKEGSIGQELVSFLENYTWLLAVDSGNGFIVQKSGLCSSGQSFTVDIRPYLSVGQNKIRFSVTGSESQQVKSIVVTANLTSLVLNCTHTWQKAWIEGEPFYLNGIFFSGNMQKILKIRVDEDVTYSQVFSASTSYTGTSFIYNLTNNFPGTTGIHKIEVWIEGVGVVTPTFTFNIMCIKASDRLTAKLVCLNEIKTEVLNYEDIDCLKFASYGVTQVTFNVTSNDTIATFLVVSGLDIHVNPEEKATFSLNLQVPTEIQTGVTLSISANVGAGSTPQTVVIPVNNLNAFPAVSNPTFFMNSSLRSNGSLDKEVLINDTTAPAITQYPAVWTGFTWEKDGWATDDKGIKCLSIQAGSHVESVDFKPLSELANGNSLTLEWKMKVDNISDYNNPIMSFMSTETYNENTTNGIIVFPTKLQILNTINRNLVQQSVLFEEGQQLHIIIVFQRNYGNTGLHLCRIYINGIQQCVFQYGGTASFGNGSLRLGQTSSDLDLYMVRYYNNVVFEADSVLKNWLNTLTQTVEQSRTGLRQDNDIYDGVNMSYELVKQKGFNTMVVETEANMPIPSLDNTSVQPNTTLTVEYAQHPEHNFKITGAPCDGQGTTSKKYYRWNLRWKLGSGSTWTYADNSTSSKSGWFDGVGVNPKVSKITAKKNIASSSQGHKMGATAMYHELYKELNLTKDLPVGARVAVYQYPVIGFQKLSDGTYQYIGLYTVGPDKGDAGTFGYDTTLFPKLLSIEGPNHAPLGTRFLHPWIDAEYNVTDESLTFGGEEAWDMLAFPDKTYLTSAGILGLYESEWKPAYDLVYFCSTYLKSITETGLTLSAINEAPLDFRNGSNLIAGRRNEVVTLYDGDYNLIYYRNYTKQYEILVGHNVKDYLVGYLANTVNPTTSELVAARKAKFYAEAKDFFDIQTLAYHENFLFLVGASDNHAKNMYPFKLKTFANGGRWQFRQDDLDTVLATDNNGNSTKPYYVEPEDLTAGGTDIYQGSSSVLWTLFRATFQTEIKLSMQDMITKLKAIASRKNLSGAFEWQTVLNMFSHYFWDTSSKYFPMRAYSEDAVFGYLSVWVKGTGLTYNGVYPLSQSLGTQLEAEQYWALRRIIYVFSKYEIGAFTGSASDGFNSIEFTPFQQYEFKVTPAIDMYPSGNLGGGTTQNYRGLRTKAGSVCSVMSTSDGTTTFYLKGLDWLISLGDLKGLVLASRGVSQEKNFSVKSKRLRFLKVGDVVAGNVAFNATALAVEGESIEEVDVRNVITIEAPVDLSKCPRLKVAKFEGSSVPEVKLPSGSKISQLSLPATVKNIYLQELPMLTTANLSISSLALANVRSLYISDCPNISAINILRSIFNTPNNDVHFLNIVFGTVSGVASDLTVLANLTEPYNAVEDTGYGRVTYNPVSGTYDINGGERPLLSGAINVPVPAYRKDVDALSSYFNLLNITVAGYYQFFLDAEVNRVMSTEFGDGNGMLETAVPSVSELLGKFTGNQIITEFNELKEFIGITTLTNGAFKGCTNLETIKLPTNLINLGVAGTTGFGVFENCTSLESVELPISTEVIGYKAFAGCSNVDLVLPPNLEVISKDAFVGCGNVTSLTIPSSIISIAPNALKGLKNIQTLNLPVGYNLSIYNDFSFKNISLASLNQSIINCASGTLESPKEIILLYTVYNALELAYSTAISDAELRHINVSKAGFIPFVCKPELTTPELVVADFALEGKQVANIYDIYSENESEDKKFIYAFTNDNVALTLTPSETQSFTYGYTTIATGIETVVQVPLTTAGGVAVVNPFSNTTTHKRWVIVKNTSLESIVAQIQYGTLWSYLGKKIIDLMAHNVSALKYLHLELNTSIERIGYVQLGFQSLYNTGITGKLTIPPSVVSIGWRVFRGCTLLVGDLVIPDSVKVIDEESFLGCSGFTDVILTKVAPPTLAINVFLGIKLTANIYVPDASVAAYKAATNWSVYADKIFGISTKP